YWRRAHRGRYCHDADNSGAFEARGLRALSGPHLRDRTATDAHRGDPCHRDGAEAASPGLKKGAVLSALYSWLARAASRNRWVVLGAWVVLLVVSGVAAGQVERVLKVGGFSIPGTEFNTTSSILSRQLHLSSDKAALVVVHSPTLRVTDKRFYDAVQHAVDNLRREPYVVK